MINKSTNPQQSRYQLEFLIHELKLIVNHRNIRWLTCWFSGGSQVIITYRLDRFGYLVFKKAWAVLRLTLLPSFIFARLMGGNHEIHYKADLGKGLQVLHPALGVVVAGGSIIGKNLVLTGGNCIGTRKTISPEGFVLGNNINLGANAVILGPIHLGSNIQIGAGAVVIADAPDNVVLAGVPAKIIYHDQSEDYKN